MKCMVQGGGRQHKGAMSGSGVVGGGGWDGEACPARPAARLPWQQLLPAAPRCSPLRCAAHPSTHPPGQQVFEAIGQHRPEVVRVVGAAGPLQRLSPLELVYPRRLDPCRGVIHHVEQQVLEAVALVGCPRHIAVLDAFKLANGREVGRLRRSTRKGQWRHLLLQLQLLLGLAEEAAAAGWLRGPKGAAKGRGGGGGGRRRGAKE